MDVIRLRDVTVFPRLGVAEIEKEWVQKVTLDVELILDLRAAAETDDVTKTVDYERVYQRIREVAHGRKFHLIESLAGDIARMIVGEFEVERTIVRVRKTNLPFDANLSCVEVELERRRT
jgi:7,8-dihydroneopterin aldolase/epimerase/oxygenase